MAKAPITRINGNNVEVTKAGSGENIVYAISGKDASALYANFVDAETKPSELSKNGFTIPKSALTGGNLPFHKIVGRKLEEAAASHGLAV